MGDFLLRDMVRVAARREAQFIDGFCLRAVREGCGVAIVRPGDGTLLVGVEPLLPECSIVEFPTKAAYLRWREDPDRFMPKKASWRQRRQARKLAKQMVKEGA